MEKKRLATICSLASLTTASLIALYWTIHYFSAGYVPIAEYFIGTVPENPIALPIKLSRWLDIFIGFFWPTAIILAHIIHKHYDGLKLSKNRRLLAHGLTISLFVSLTLSLVMALANGLIAGLCAFVVLCLMFYPVVGLFSGLLIFLNEFLNWDGHRATTK